jgi:hypothetical protein
MVDGVMIGPAYDGQVFKVALADVPERNYDLPIPDGPTTVAVKITDKLGEELLCTAAV